MKEAAEKAEWDRSTKMSEAEQKTAEDRVAAKIVNDMMRDNKKLGAVHSKISMKKLLEKEAKRQLLEATNGGIYEPPVMSRIIERGTVNRKDPSNLPYLHKCPAV